MQACVLLFASAILYIFITEDAFSMDLQRRLVKSNWKRCPAVYSVDYDNKSLQCLQDSDCRHRHETCCPHPTEFKGICYDFFNAKALELHAHGKDPHCPPVRVCGGEGPRFDEEYKCAEHDQCQGHDIAGTALCCADGCYGHNVCMEAAEAKETLGLQNILEVLEGAHNGDCNGTKRFDNIVDEKSSTIKYQENQEDSDFAFDDGSGSKHVNRDNEDDEDFRGGDFNVFDNFTDDIVTDIDVRIFDTGKSLTAAPAPSTEKADATVMLHSRTLLVFAAFICVLL